MKKLWDLLAAAAGPLALLLLALVIIMFIAYLAQSGAMTSNPGPVNPQPDPMPWWPLHYQ